MRQIFNYFGGKWRLRKIILAHLPRAEVYVEAFGGSGSVLMERRPAPSEIFNDLDDRVTNLFRVLQDPEKNLALRRRIYFTPYSRAEFCRALKSQNDGGEIDRAWAFYTAQNQGFGGKAETPGNWGYSLSRPNIALGWVRRKKNFFAWLRRLENVQIENKDALDIIKRYDSLKTLFYLDPPYVYNTRVSKNDYRYDQPDTFHEELVDILLDVKGGVVLSGYANKIYNRLTQNQWTKKDFQSVITCSKIVRTKRVESLYINHVAQKWLDRDRGKQLLLFTE